MTLAGMIKTVIAILTVALVTVSCTRGVSRIQTRSLPSPNPTSYLFPLPLAEVHARALEAFSLEQQDKQPMFAYPTNSTFSGNILSAECSTNAAFAEAIFRDPANANDIYLHSFGMPFEASPVYCGRNGGLPFVAAFHLHLTDSGSNTLVNVTALDTLVFNGWRFGIGRSGPGYVVFRVKVKPTTVEEYTILRYLGRSLGITNMPDVILPKP